MSTKYIKYEEVEKIIGHENMIKFYERMKKIFEVLYKDPKGKKVRIGFVQHDLYDLYDMRCEEGEEVPRNYDYLMELCEILEEELFIKLLNTCQGKSIWISYTHVRNAMIYEELRKGKYIQDVANRYSVSPENARKIKERYNV